MRKKQENPSSNSYINYRFQLGINGSLGLTDTHVNPVDTLRDKYIEKQPTSFGIAPMVGFEKGYRYGKVSVYGGMDAGLFYNHNTVGYSYIPNWGYTEDFQDAPTSGYNYGVSISPFIGINYRFNQHLSASMESSFLLSYMFSRTNYGGISSITNGVAQYWPQEVQSTSGINFSMRYLRLLTLNYHF